MTGKKKLILIPILFLILISFSSASYYGKGFYGLGNYSISGEVISETTPPASSSGGGSSCTYDWGCTEWFPKECPALGIQERICINRGTCTGTKEMPELTRTCIYEHKEPLFDIFLNISKKEFCADDTIKAKIKLENYGKIELLDAFMTYWILNENNQLIAEVKDTRAVSDEIEFEIEIKIPKSTPKGNYKLYSQINYVANQTAIAGESFEILSQEECKLIKSKTPSIKYIFYTLLGIIIILITGLIIIAIKKIKSRKKDSNKHKKYKEKIKQNLKKIKSKKHIIILSCLLVCIFVIIEKNITGSVIDNTIKVINLSKIFALLFISSSIGLMLMFYKRRLKIKIKKEIPKEQVGSLIDKKVYTEEGEYIGDVEEIHFEKNKIKDIQIKLNKTRFNFKGIIINYKKIEGIGEIIIIKEHLVEILKNKKI